MSTQKQVKTITQFEKMSKSDIKTNQDENWLIVSKIEDVANKRYSSRKINYQNLSEQITTDATDSIRNRFRMYTVNQQIDADVNGMYNDIRRILSGDNELSGQKAFQYPPIVTNVRSDNDNYLATVGSVKSTIYGIGGYYGPDSKTKKFPVNFASDGSVNGSVYDVTTSTPFYYWRIDDGQKDSSKFVNDDLNTAAGCVKIQKTGMLTIYGWLADKGTVTAQESWVGLFAKINNSDGTEGFAPLQISPWIQGNKHSVLQYVGFNVHVKTGLELKIMTGFPVNGSNGSMTTGDCLCFKDQANMPNTLIGYIVYDE